jgi:ATP-dependent Clp protease adaptor protein ClpS
MPTEFGTPQAAEETIVLTRPTRPKPKEAQQTKPLPPYAVVLHNDDLNTFEFVICVLQKVFNYDLPKAFSLTREAHETGRSVVWSGSLEVAELKADQIRSCGPDPTMKQAGAGPLSVSIEQQ